MKPIEIQRTGHIDDLLSASASDEQSNDFVSRRPSASPVAVKHQNRAANIPPAVPSPPSLSSRRSPSPLLQVPHSSPTIMATSESEAPNQWMFTEEEVHNSPSILDGLTFLEESCRRAKGINFIIQAGILLKIPQLTLGTAAVFFHRFYMRYSMVAEKGGIHHYASPAAQNIAATALFLAAKAEENCRKTKEMVIAVAKVAQKNANLIIDEQSKEFWRWKDSILLYEEIMLEILTFDVVIESPYTLLYDFLRVLEIETNKPLRNAAWAFVNDSYMTTLCLMMTARDIAVASIYFSAKLNHERISDDRDGRPWWVYLYGCPERMCKAIDVMADFYTDNPLKKTDNPYDRSPQSSIEDLDRTRLRADSLSPNSRIRAEEMDDEESQQNGINGAVKGGDSTSGKAEYSTIAGDDDTKLKAIANCPETHEQSQENGILNGLVSASYGGASSKRKESDTDITDKPDAKRLKSENDESEEGEVEE